METAGTDDSRDVSPATLRVLPGPGAGGVSGRVSSRVPREGNGQGGPTRRNSVEGRSPDSRRSLRAGDSRGRGPPTPSHPPFLCPALGLGAANLERGAQVGVQGPGMGA